MRGEKVPRGTLAGESKGFALFAKDSYPEQIAKAY